MRVLVFVKKFAAPTLTFIYNEVTELSKHAQVKLLTFERANELKFPFDDVEILQPSHNSVRKKLLHSFQTRDFLFSYKDAKLEKQISKIIKEFQPDVIHTHFGHESWWFLANLKSTNIPIFISFHGFDASHKLHSARYLTTLKHFMNQFSLNVIFASNFMANQVEKKIGSVTKKYVLHYGTNINLFQRESYEYPKSPIKFLQISSFAEKKGHLFTIQAFYTFLKSNPLLTCTLTLAGEGQTKGDTKQLVKQLGISENVIFPGLVNMDEAKNLMEESHVFVHHSITSSIGDQEGIPNAIMEAMAMELPVISTFHSGIPELVEDEINGYLVQEKAIIPYSIAMEKAIKMGYLKINRVKVATDFEKSTHSTKLIEFYNKSLTQKK